MILDIAKATGFIKEDQMNVEKRIVQLEKQTKMQRLGIFGLGITLVATMLLAMTAPQTTNLIASSLTILNKEGKPVISMNDEGLVLLDENSIARIAMGINPQDKSVGVAFMDNKSVPRIAIGTEESGAAGITLIAAGMREMMSGVVWPPKSSGTSEGPAAAQSSDDVFSRFTALAGDWEVDAGEMGTIEITYRTIANGSSVVETMLSGNPSEMISVIHQDIDHLRLTHFCAVGNQPHLIATEIGENHVTFETDQVANHPDANSVYMGKATWTFIDEDHIQTQWWSFTNGEQDPPLVFDFKRIQP